MSQSEHKGAAAQVNEIMAQLAALDAEFEASDSSQMVPSQPVFRVLVATDWSSATVPLAALRVYAELFALNAPTALVFAVPHEPTQADLDAVTVLVRDGLGPDVDTAGLAVESFAEASVKSSYAAIVPNGDGDALLMELTQFLINLHTLSNLVRDPARLAEEPSPIDSPNFGLARRFEAFEADAPLAR